MMSFLALLLFSLGVSLTFIVPIAGAQAAEPSLEERVRALELKSQQGQAVPSPEDDELTRLQLQLQLPEPLGPSFSGLAPGMSRIYSSRTPLVIGGFADIDYTTESRGSQSTSLARFNPYFAWRFSQGLVFNSGLSLQNGGTEEDRGSVQAEFAYLDILTGRESGIRAGHVIVPFGLLAYRSEPTLYPLVHRPTAETLIVPSTWHENGVLGFAKLGRLHLQGGLLNSTDAVEYETGSWIRGGRQSGSRAKASDAAFALRAEWLTTSTAFGISAYTGNSAQGNERLGRANVLMMALHAEARHDRWSAKAFFVEGALSDTDQIYTVTNQAIGARSRGGYLIVFYDLLPRISPYARSLIDTPVVPGWRELPIFISYEYANPEASPAVGRPRTPDIEDTRVTFGINYKPHPQVVFKTDVVHEFRGSDSPQRILEAAVAAVF